MTANVFFSWQSDRPPIIGRNLIERALEAAVRQLNTAAVIEPARRLAVQSGTKGKAGIVPVTDTIFQRIDAASVVVTDVTYVSSRPEGGGSPNPNVLIEHGYAFKSRSGARMIHVMNTAFGHPKQQELPFDLRHMTWPILFHCAAGSDTSQRKAVRDQLSKEFVAALTAILGDESLPPASLPADPHPHDVRLMQEIYGTFTLPFRHFLRTQDFRIPFRAKMLEPLHQAAEWMGATYQFHDADIERAFSAVREHTASLGNLAVDHIFTHGDKPMIATVRGDGDRATGLQPETREAVSAMNEAGSRLAEALDAFELVSRDRVRLSAFDKRPA